MTPEDLSGRWVHVREEDTEDEMVFRPVGTPLPPARGRVAFELRPDGSFAESGLGAADVGEEATGDWAVDGDTVTLSEGASPGRAARDEGGLGRARPARRPQAPLPVTCGSAHDRSARAARRASRRTSALTSSAHG